MSDSDSDSSMPLLEARDSSDDDDYYTDNASSDSDAGMPVLANPYSSSDDDESFGDFSIPSDVPGLREPGAPSSDEESVEPPIPTRLRVNGVDQTISREEGNDFMDQLARMQYMGGPEGGERSAPFYQEPHREAPGYGSFDTGDKVVFVDVNANDTNWTRGIIVSVMDLDGSCGYGCVPLDKDPNQDNNVVFCHKMYGHKLARDVFPTVFEFEVQDLVRVKYQAEWYRANVDAILPYFTYQNEPDNTVYKCKFTDGRKVGGDDNCCVPQDETCILPYQESRFNIMDNVSVALNPNAKPKDVKWTSGMIINADFTTQNYPRPVLYSVSTEAGDVEVTVDTNEVICRDNSSPFEKLMEALEQDCSEEYYQFLIDDGKIGWQDMTDDLVSKAVQGCSYNALFWLQSTLGIDLSRHLFTKGRSFLHEIAYSPKADAFFEAAGKSYIVFGDAMRLRDKTGQTFLHSLVIKKNVKALHRILSRDGDFCWNCLSNCNEILSEDGEKRQILSIEEWKDKQGRTAQDIAAIFGQYHIVRMLSEYTEFNKLRQVSNELSVINQYTTVDSIQSQVDQLEGISNSISLVNKLSQYEDQYFDRPFNGIRPAYHSAARNGNLQVLKWLVNARSDLLKSTQLQGTLSDQGEFLPGFVDHTSNNYYGTKDDDANREDLNVIAAAVAGYNFFRLDNSFCNKKACMDDYWSLISKWDGQGDLSETIESHSTSNVLLLHRRNLLTDEENVDKRLDILDWLVQNHSSVAGLPNVVDIVRWRQCFVLRWMTEKSFLNLKSQSSTDEKLSTRCTTVLPWLKRRRLPKKITIGGALCFLAIQYDDLQTLEWVLSQGNKLHETSAYGWNLLHASAGSGRVEISYWLVNRYPNLIQKSCNSDGLKSSHIAIISGHLRLAKVLRAKGCPDNDSKGKSVFNYAIDSDKKLIREWGVNNERKGKFETDLSTLCEMLSNSKPSLHKIQDFIVSSKCMDESSWFESDYQKDPLQLTRCGKSYFDLIEDMVKIGNSTFLIWLHDKLLPDSYFDVRQDAPVRSFWNTMSQKPTETEVLSELKRRNDQSSLSCIDKDWYKDSNVSLSDIAPLDPIILRFMKIVENRSDSNVTASILGLKNNLVYLFHLSISLEALIREFRRLFCDGSPVEKLKAIHQTSVFLHDQLKTIKPNHPIDFFRESPLSSNGKIMIHASFNQETKDSGLDRFGDGPLVFSALEGNLHILQWFYDFESETFHDPNVLVQLSRSAAYRGKIGVIQWIMNDVIQKKGQRKKALLAILTGGAEGGRLDIVHQYFQQAGEREINVNKFNESGDIRRLSSSSVIGAAVTGLFRESNSSSLRTHVDCMKWLLVQNSIDSRIGLQVAIAYTTQPISTSSYSSFKTFVSIFEEYPHEDVWFLRHDIILMVKSLTVNDIRLVAPDVKDKFSQLCIDFLLLLSETYGVDIQIVDDHNFPIIAEKISSLQRDQKDRWKIFDPLRVQYGERPDAVLDRNLFDSEGLRMAHCAAVNNRTDVLRYISNHKPENLRDLDKSGRTLKQLCIQKNAIRSLEWIKQEGAATRIASCYRRKQAFTFKKSALKSILQLQKLWRGFVIRKIYREGIIEHLEEAIRFRRLWRNVTTILNEKINNVSESKNDNVSWDDLKRNSYDMSHNEDDEEEDEKLSMAMAASLKQVDEDKEDFEDIGVGEEEEIEPNTIQNSSYVTDSIESVVSIKLTKDVLKWLKRADSKFAGLFLRRIKQLSSGQKSRILAKHLTGCKTTINETYLEQKSGHRIVWTPLKEGNKPAILVWYVARHKMVSKYIQLIDAAEGRTNRQLTAASALFQDEPGEESLQFEPDCILLDPKGDTPLKIHEIAVEHLSKLENKHWTPPLRLTVEEKISVAKDGNVLLLGRSGTGKTISIANRISHDRVRVDENISFKQLFIARSKRICNYVTELVEDDQEVNSRKNHFAEYSTFLDLLRKCEKEATKNAGSLLRGKFVDYKRFKRELYDQHKYLLDPLVVWTQIRSYIKGSIEAMMKQDGSALSEDEYYGLGETRCQLSQEKRQVAYQAYMSYVRQMECQELWDSCDRMIRLIRGYLSLDLEQQMTLKYDKLYVDEVQDYTQAEIALFYLLCKKGGLFLAGDTAQSVEYGVAFRFEEVRSVAHVLYKGDRQYIPDKPLRVHINFRSHAGILNIASSILDRLFAWFPRSAHKLKNDEGLFLGPRPGLIQLDENDFKQFMIKNKGIVILVHDEKVSIYKEKLGSDQVILGIRESKGLEFNDVIVLNFFADLDNEHQKPWRDLLSMKEIIEEGKKKPELEPQLKLLYTAVTRCCKRLFFIQTTETMSGKAFIRWTIEQKLAEKQSSSTIDIARTPDEWRTTGVDYATIADSCESSLTAIEWLDRAIDCFEQVNETRLIRKAQTNKDSAKLRVILDDLDLTQTSDDDLVNHERNVSQLVYSCLEEGITPEARKICIALVPYLSEFMQAKIEREVIERIERIS